MIDPFEEHLQQWMRGVQQEARARQEDCNLSKLTSLLQASGHTVSWDKTYHYLSVNANGPRPLTITAQNAREMQPETLLQWVKEQSNG